MIEKILSNGKLHITEEVLAIITLLAIEDVEGIAKSVSGIKDDIFGVLKPNYTKKGISIENDKDGVEINIKISVYFENNVVEICEKLQHLVAQEIYAMTGVSIKNINIKVDQIIKAS
ncbi:Asp23/Gls24 family envelope stress response protein [Cytobacillus sp. S13-E01]|uniref:Asp23/Gls24 family envelope stress response protein n=1 Tax=Cytobacillus sp. S13-E01 TaxID=3031326 RepID=UPI0023D7E477|nr:Asp23/Gls24 family envelope stress response protein [Cytobacillus sp. S13-E01]MDF0725316.1 Asp23/Gls24 family envelope stress response protein [Cytobacillus sp. S13-E01]